MVGRKSKDLFDTIDLQILETLENNPRPLGVLELTEKLRLTHQNLKHHLEKLIKLGLILHGNVTYISSEKPKTGKIELTVPTSDWCENFFEEFPYGREAHLKEKKEFSTLMKFLRKSRDLDYPKETLKQIIKELNKDNSNISNPNKKPNKE